MDWTRFDNHGESNNHAFEVMCNLLFESWCKDTYGEELTHFSFVNGDGGDGGVEAFASLTNGDIIAVQSKWFPEKIEDGQIRQIEKSFQTAVAVRPNIKEYVVCVPRDLGNKRIVRDRKVANNTESDRWDKLSSDLKKSNPNVNIILWDETSIQERLTRPENQGIYKYWFENTIVFDDLFKFSFEKTVNGWAKAKYIPEIHTAGYIHNQLEYFVGSIELSFIIALAYQFILDQGWNKERFWGYEDKDNLGIDIVIRRTYYPATHGEMSRVMTVAEKNVWLAKHKIEAIFANEIPLSKDYETFQYVDDYSQLEDFTNTYQDYANTLHRAKKHTWFNADLLACLDCETIDKEKIERWMQNTDIPQFNKWISNTNGEVLLYTATDVQNNLSGITETVWISAGAVKKNDFQQLLILLDNYCEDRNELLNVCDFHSYQDCRCYCTPQEACLVHSEREINSVLSIGKDNSKIEIFKLVEECLSADEMETERYYTFPSKLTRGLTGIVYGDGFSYSDKRGNVIARYSDSGERWGTFQQTLMINYDRLMSGLTEAELMPVWLFRLYREPSPKARERFDNLMHSSDKTFMVWQEGNQFRFKELLPLEPERNDQTVNVDFNLESILKRYTISGEDELVDMGEDDIVTFDEITF